MKYHCLPPKWRIMNYVRQIGSSIAFRELLIYHIDAKPDYAQYLPNFREAAFLSRTYRIVFEGRPITVITENMPRDLFAKSIPLDHARGTTPQES